MSGEVEMPGDSPEVLIRFGRLFVPTNRESTRNAIRSWDQSVTKRKGASLLHREDCSPARWYRSAPE
jgi:hypothetical protein